MTALIILGTIIAYFVVGTIFHWAFVRIDQNTEFDVEIATLFMDTPIDRIMFALGWSCFVPMMLIFMVWQSVPETYDPFNLLDRAWEAIKGMFTNPKEI